ncbi:AAA family ATPase [Tuwongella immobilis]|uniref:ORC1/DEAH AAA+ ATPase domain-containing protein n=1 Tax=Tuwongella immobilis TaxID=692036 RepID=A0A6C2YV64_9BACT|nr:AAA family ATPase [Tuwongella immobilis]VIP05334.1 atpase involved in dna repair : Uncharacterized protein OS=Sinorhizobium fredii USDA 257 GN=USDA257_c04360 PE=4 SV=1: PhoH [Tuwongella immobilis]VTS08024.1 atpase involved in dna repair : Uncharacterized protein OS=Sinorhizobium fredii USDA 257 GN=USDA257_c04360 PE=4 SV=1: PhoH [Tuwongella immobilis]
MAQIPLPVCWEVERVADAVTTLAKVSEEKAGYFLATHAPIKHLIGEKGFVTQEGGKLRDQELYEQLMEGWEHRKPGQDLSVLVWGEAGTGKSHLITWTKLRLDADAHKYPNVLAVLVRRKNGSLKDALSQIIEQLGEKFGKYLQPVKDAIARLSEETARQQLRQAIALELGPRRIDRGRKPIVETDKKLRYLAAACGQSTGFGRWLTRDGGVVARAIKLLIEESDVTDRENRPRFTGDDLKILNAADKHAKVNSGEVCELIDELDSNDALLHRAAALINEAMDDAIAEMTGLSGGNLYRIFENIRRDLKAEKKRLALFIEDVSAMSVLDLEVVKAVEPRGDDSLCPLLAVMGVTDAGFKNRLRDNDKQRVTHIASLGNKAVNYWKEDAEGLAEFTARYLNAVRLSPKEIEKVAAHRRKGDDVSISKCTHCKQADRCHKAFGKVTFDGVDVGLYPFTLQAPIRLLSGLTVNENLGIAKTPRGYLENVVGPVLRDTTAIVEHEFPRPETLTHVDKTPPHYWTAFENNFGGNWSDTDKRRARLLAQYWASSDISSAEGAAQALDGFLGVLGLPDFTEKVKKIPEGESQPKPATPANEPTKPKQNTIPPQLSKTLGNLDVWINGGELRDDKRVREWLAALIRKCIPWDDLREPPRAVWQSLINKGKDEDAEAYAYIRIEGQVARVASQRFFVDFPRTQETRELIEALARFQYEGSNSWSFEQGEWHKRVVARWLRSHETEVVQSLQPKGDVSPDVAIGVAASLLSLAAIIRERRKLPESQTEFVASIVKPLAEGRDKLVPFSPKKEDWRSLVRDDSKLGEPGKVVALTKRWQDLAGNLYSRHASWLRFVHEELEVPQGRTGEVNFIDPRPLLAVIEPLRKDLSIGRLDDAYFSDFWENRFTRLGKTERYGELSTALAEERAEIGRIAGEVKEKLEAWGYPASDSAGALRAFLSDFAEVHEARKISNVIVSDSEFESLQRSQHLTRRVEIWGKALTEAGSVASGTDSIEVLTFDPRELLDLHSAVRILNNFLTRLEKEVSDTEVDLAVDGDPEAIKTQLLSTLDQLARTAEGSSDDETQELEGSA